MLRVASPFDYASKARLIIAMKTDPRQADRHTEEVAQLLRGLITTLGTLVLFCSGRQMRRVHAALGPVRIPPNLDTWTAANWTASPRETGH